MAFRLQHKEFIRYPDQAFTKLLAGVAMQNDYHFFLQLKSIQRYNTRTGKIIPFNSFTVDEIKQLEDLIKLPAVIRGKSKIDFDYYLKRCLKMKWISEYGINYNLKSLNKINQELGFQTYEKNGITYYSYRRLPNVQGIDLQAHRIHQIIMIKEKQFKYEVRNNPKNVSQLSRTAVNKKLIASSSKKKSKVSCSAEYFGIAISTIKQSGGYDSNAFVWDKLNQMQKQGFKIKKDKSAFDKHKKRDCNLYQTYYNGIFKTFTEQKQAETVIGLNRTENKFKNLLNNTKFRIAAVNAGLMSNSFLKFTKANELVKIPIKAWSNMLVKMLNNPDFKSYLLQFLEPEEIWITHREKSAKFKTVNFECPYGQVNVHHVTLVDRHGNYNNYSNEVLKEYEGEIEQTNRNIIINNNIRNYKPMQEGYLLPNPLMYSYLNLQPNGL